MRYFISLLIGLFIVTSLSTMTEAAELSTAFAVVRYADTSLLKTFTKRMGKSSFGFGFGHSRATNTKENARKQVNLLIGRVQEILDMRPKNLHFTIEILASAQQVQAIYKNQYGRKVDFIAFYSPKSETVYVAINKLKRTVIAHEIAHAVIDHYFDNPPPVKIHEMLAQYVEKQL